jgi:4-amino-4-deoxy-L-arabinose transferase-like glycosyltransferase
MLSLYSWRAENCFAPDELFYYKGSQSLSDLKNLFGPEYYGEHRFQKPPLFYLTVFISFKLFGVNWFAARLPSILSSIGLLAMTYLMGLKMFNDEDKALFGAALLGTNIIFFRFGHISLPEMTFILFVTAAIYFTYRAFAENRRGFFCLSFLFMGIGSLVKGPIAVILPCVVMVVFGIINRRNNLSTRIPWLGGLMIVFGLNLLWLIPAFLIYGKTFFSHILNTEITYRVAGRGAMASLDNYLVGYLKRIPFYISAIFTQYLPWSALAPLLLFFSGGKSGQNNFRPQRLFLIIWFLAGFLVFISIASIRFHYVLSLFPALSLYLISFFDFGRAKVKKIFTSVSAITISIYLIATATFIPLIFSDGVDRLSLKLNDELKIKDAPSAVSWRVDYQKVQLHIDRPVGVITGIEFVEWICAKPFVENLVGKAAGRTPLFYVIIAEEEYGKYFDNFISMAERVVKKPLSRRKLSEDWRWRKKIKIKNLLDNIMQNPRMTAQHLKTAFQEKVFLIYVRCD